MKYEKELKATLEAARAAEPFILSVYNTPFEVEIKEDNSPVTKADKGADELIRATLSALFPEDGFLTEESTDNKERLNKKRIWIVDPVDGTKEFVSRNGQFTTNIALAEDKQVVVGVINAPTLGLTYYAVKGEGAYKMDKSGKVTRLSVSDRDDCLRALRSISFFNEREKAFMEKNAARFEGEPKPIGAALKFCTIAEGGAEYFIRMSGGTKEWDVAPGDLIVTEAGGVMVQPNGIPFSYNREDVYNREGYVIANKKSNLML